MRSRFVLIAMLPVLQAQAVPPAGFSQTYKDASTGLIIHYPAGWRLDTKWFQGFTIIDFPPSEGQPPALVPMDRAEIGMSGPPEGEKTIAEWMRKERINESRGNHISEIALATRGLGTLKVTVARAQPTVFPGSTSLLYFFDVDGHPVKATLFYRGRKRAAEFEGIFNSIIENLEPLPGH